MLSAYYHYDDSNIDLPYNGANVPGFNANSLARQQMATASDTKNFGASAVNEFRLGYMRDAVFSTKPEGGVGPKLNSFGFVEGAGTLGIVPLLPSLEGVPHISLNNVSFGVGSAGEQYNEIYQVRDVFSKISGTHNVKFGGEFHFDKLITRTSGGVRNGQFSFNGSETG